MVISPKQQQMQIPQAALSAGELQQLTEGWHSTLNVRELLELLFQEARSHVHFDHLQYLHASYRLDYSFGEPGPNASHYSLHLDEQHLGELIVTRQAHFEAGDLRVIQRIVETLVSPLRNCLKYHTALLKSYTDPLTGVGNRNAFDQAIEREFEFSRRQQTSLSLLLMDLDNFKEVNDSHGHPAGDAVLKGFTERVLEVCRSSDIFFRLGGDEFALLLAHTPLQGARQAAERILSSLEHPPFLLGGEPFVIKCSLGVGTLSAEEPLASFIKRVDGALYDAKDNGKSCLQLAES